MFTARNTSYFVHELVDVPFTHKLIKRFLLRLLFQLVNQKRLKSNAFLIILSCLDNYLILGLRQRWEYQSRRQGGFGGLSPPQTKLQAPQIEI